MLQQSSTFLRHEACPKCGSKDNLARYSDGAAHCFTAGCGYKERPAAIPSWKQPAAVTKTTYETIPSHIKYDLADFPKPAVRWLFQYGITGTQIRKYGIGYNAETNGIFLPIRATHTMDIIAWQERYLTGNKKYLTFRIEGVEFKNLVWVAWGNDTVVLVEDIISAIKVAEKGYTAIALLGVKLNWTCLNLISNYAKKVVVWLDNDNPAVTSFAYTIQQKVSLLGKEVVVIREEGNPKDKLILPEF